MRRLDQKKWLERNGALELFERPGFGGTSGLWVGHGGIMFDSFSHDPVGHLYDQAKKGLWVEIKSVYGS